ncbi:hypothetical protein DAT35_23755 [Vitiosangium sp. GDMCC 1.1324]|nr:hypothetical protein DAT35_23755 [Vitiosangium sp. GDMCC 1.1324]
MTTPQKRPFDFQVVYQIPGEEPLRDVLLTEDLPLELRVTNALLQENEAILLNTLTEVSPEQFHFLLECRAGLLAPANTTTPDGNWKLLRVEESGHDTTQIFLAWTQATKRLEAGEMLTVPLKGLFMAPEVARPTLPLLLSWPELTPATASSTGPLSVEPFIPGEGSDYELEAYLILQKKIWGGKARIPLRLDSVGTHRVLNVNNQPNTLVFRITNNSPPGSGGENITFHYNASKPTENSFLQLRLPVGTVAQRPYALGTSDQLKDITRALPGFKAETGSLSPDGTMMIFQLTPTASLVLKPGEHRDLTVSNLVTGHPSGLSELELTYHQVPGFRDGKLTCPVEKAPLVFGRDAKGGSVGIGDNSSDARLAIRGGPLRLEGAEVQSKESMVFRSDEDKTGDSNVARFFVKDASTPLLTLDVNAKVSLRTGTAAHGYQHTEGTVTVGTYVKNGSAPVGGSIGTSSAHPLHFFTDNSSPRMTLTTEGRLGIGTQSPGAPLDVQGNVFIQNNGRLGIGTENPGAALDVHGTVQVKDRKPFELIRLTSTDSQTWIVTTYSASEWHLAVCGFRAEFAPGKQGIYRLQTEVNTDGFWTIASRGVSGYRSFTCYVLCIRRELSVGFSD